MLTLSGIGDNARPPGQVHHASGTTTTRYIPYDSASPNRNRFIPLSDKMHHINNICVPKYEGSIMIQMVKNNKSYCPPIVATPMSSPDIAWTTVKNRKITMRKTTIKTNSENNAVSPTSVILNHNNYNSISSGVLIKSTDINGRVTKKQTFFKKQLYTS